MISPLFGGKKKDCHRRDIERTKVRGNCYVFTHGNTKRYVGTRSELSTSISHDGFFWWRLQDICTIVMHLWLRKMSLIRFVRHYTRDRIAQSFIRSVCLPTPSLTSISSNMPRRRSGDNDVWDDCGRRERRTSLNVPTKTLYPRAYLWLCAEDDISEEFLKNSFVVPPLIVTCKDEPCPHVEAACHNTGTPMPKLFNIGYYHNREYTFFNDILPSVKEALENGRDVVLHCRAGVHRAALTYCCVTMHLKGCSFDEARQGLEHIRAVKIDEIVHPCRRRDGTWTEDHMHYVNVWEQAILRDPARWASQPSRLVEAIAAANAGATKVAPHVPLEELQHALVTPSICCDVTAPDVLRVGPDVSNDVQPSVCPGFAIAHIPTRKAEKKQTGKEYFLFTAAEHGCLACVRELVEVEAVSVHSQSQTQKYTALDFAEWAQKKR